MKHLPLIALALMLTLTSCGQKTAKPATASASEAPQAAQVAFSGDSAYAHVVRQCDFGPRTPGSTAHQSCGDWLAAQFKAYGLSVTEQTAPITAWDGKTFTCRNIIASHNPGNPDRVIICAHWDSRPWADCERDEAKRRMPILGANDGASGVGVMLELARLMRSINPAVGVDLICFDLEDYGRPDWEEPGGTDAEWCLGSAHWAAHPHTTGYTARWAVLLDMVGDPRASFHYEGFSLHYAPALVARVWGAAQTVGAGNLFPQKDGSYVTDDHLPLNRIAGIPAIDVIDFRFMGEHSFAPTWHTLADTPENISPLTLHAVGQTMVQLLSDER